MNVNNFTQCTRETNGPSTFSIWELTQRWLLRCGVTCNLWITHHRAAQQNPAVNGAVLIAQEEAAQWEQVMETHPSAVAAISAGVTAIAGLEAAAAHERHEARAAAREAAASRKAEEAIAKKETEVRALE